MARVACWGTTPLPHALSCSLRVMLQLVIQPGGRPIIHSANCGFSRACPSRPSGMVGGGAGFFVMVSHWWIAGANLPHSSEWTIVPNGGEFRFHSDS